MRKIISGLALSSAMMLTVSANAAEHIIKMLDIGEDGNIMVFEPAFVKVNKGDTIKFVSTDIGHNNSSRHIPEGAKHWTGEDGQDITVTVDKEGVYLYECNLHKLLGMVGVIQVGEAKNLTEANAAAKKLTAGMAMGADRINDYLSKIK